MNDSPQRTNRLSSESSPYLRQHQHNPVDWYAWGPEAFEAARKLRRPIFLSVGYSTCYWCHVMERQCFESPAIAAEMNQRFISIKVDREERPDVDQLYMTAVQLLTRQGGWPMSVFLTPDLRPFYGGTYFPPTDQYGRPGFPTLLRALDDAWQTRPADIDSTGDQLVGVLQRLAEPAPPEQKISIDDQFIARLIDRSISDYDPGHGGFGGAPKFPRQTLLELLLVFCAPGRTTSPRADKVRAMVLHTLDALAHGGIRDHLGGGFHRYSTDAHWLVPHFEIMLYDNAMLAWCYVEAFRQTRDSRWADVARGIFDFVLRDMTSPDGAFYTAFDAEVDAMEGASYLWTRAEVLEVLGKDGPPVSGGLNVAELFCRVYGLDDGPNFADPHHGNGMPDKNILFLPRPLEEVASELKIEPAALREKLAASRNRLRLARMERKQPLLDTKILTSWSALMIRAFAHGGQVLERPDYLAAAERAATFLLERHASADGGLLRTSGGVVTDVPATRPPIPGFLDDYAFLAQALLALGSGLSATATAPGPSSPLSRYSGGGLGRGPSEKAARFDATEPPPQPSPVRLSSPRSGVPGEGERWSGIANRIIDQMIARFGERDSNRGFFFTDLSAKELIVRQKTGTDSPISSGNGVAAMILLATGRADAARGTLAAFAESMSGQGEAMSAMIQATQAYVERHGPFVVGPAGSAEALNRPLSPQQAAEDVVRVEVLQRSESAMEIELTIQSGWHLNAHDVAGPIPLVATRVTVDPEPASVSYPRGEERKFAFADEPLLVYSGKIVIGVEFARALRAEAAPQLTLSYQACDDSTCLPPVTRRIVLNG